MAVRYHIKELDALLQDISKVLNVSILILDIHGNMLSRISNSDDYCSLLRTVDDTAEAKCHLCDKQIVERCKTSKQIEQHICHAGLCDLAMPILKDGAIVAYVVLGRMRTTLSPKMQRYPHLPPAVQARYNDLPFFTESQLKHLCQLLTKTVLACAITVEYDNFSDDIIPYIREHLNESLSVPSLCQRYHVSKNTLYRFFRERYQCSIGTFITHLRMEQSQKLLLHSSCTIRDIAEQVGIENYTYFCKLFKQQTGITPTEYRKTRNKTDESS